jgi:hypothetical protein
MNHQDGDNPDFLDGLGDMLPADVLKKLNELLARLHQADHTNHGSTVINIYEKGSLHVDHVDNQNFYNDSGPRPPKTPKTKDAPATKTFDQDTPLSALFRDNHHEELRMVIDSWRPYLVDDDAAIDALQLSHFVFDKKRIYSNHVYYDLLDLDSAGALQVSLRQLSSYLSDHSNLSNSYATLYRQIKKYRQERP